MEEYRYPSDDEEDPEAPIYYDLTANRNHMNHFTGYEYESGIKEVAPDFLKRAREEYLETGQSDTWEEAAILSNLLLFNDMQERDSNYTLAQTDINSFFDISRAYDGSTEKPRSIVGHRLTSVFGGVPTPESRQLIQLFRDIGQGNVQVPDALAHKFNSPSWRHANESLTTELLRRFDSYERRKRAAVAKLRMALLDAYYRPPVGPAGGGGPGFERAQEHFYHLAAQRPSPLNQHIRERENRSRGDFRQYPKSKKMRGLR